MQVRRLPVDPGPAAWNAILPVRAGEPSLEGKITADWLIIGAGFAGLSAARRLRQLHPQDRIVVLEARELASGPAGRNSGFMIDLPHNLSSSDYGGVLDRDAAQTAENRFAIAFAQQAAVEYAMHPEAIVASGKINAAATAKGHEHNINYAAHLTAMREPHEIYDAAQMREITGTCYYQSGLYTPGTAMLQPAQYIRGLAGGLACDRVEIYENSPVISLAKGWIAKTPKGQVTAPKVILAVNGHAESFGHFTGRLMHVFTYASMTRALTDDEQHKLGGAWVWGATPADPLGTTVRKIDGVGGARVIIRNRFTLDPNMKVSTRRIASVGRDHDKAFAARFPMLDTVGMEFRWGGRLCLSRNNVPAFGELESGLYAACCQNGLGTAKGTLHGILAAEQASGLQTNMLVQVMSQDPPVKLPPKPLTWLGANAVMRWGEWRAGAEM
ncbi:MAG: FAD-binding oxidoreductase [Yoonia sp.]|nr:FAD-binding oxidoreductase [Yoonia sp.]